MDAVHKCVCSRSMNVNTKTVVYARDLKKAEQTSEEGCPVIVRLMRSKILTMQSGIRYITEVYFEMSRIKRLPRGQTTLCLSTKKIIAHSIGKEHLFRCHRELLALQCCARNMMQDMEVLQLTLDKEKLGLQKNMQSISQVLSEGRLYVDFLCDEKILLMPKLALSNLQDAIVTLVLKKYSPSSISMQYFQLASVGWIKWATTLRNDLTRAMTMLVSLMPICNDNSGNDTYQQCHVDMRHLSDLQQVVMNVIEHDIPCIKEKLKQDYMFLRAMIQKSSKYMCLIQGCSKNIKDACALFGDQRHTIVSHKKSE